MSAALHNFDPGKVILSLGGIPKPITGYQKGTFIEVARNEDAFKMFVGADGETTRVRNRNRSGMVKIVLQQGSESNADLSALAELDELTGGGVVPLTFMDMSGQVPQTTGASTQAWIRKKPAATFGGETEEGREWILDVADLDFFIGGN